MKRCNARTWTDRSHRCDLKVNHPGMHRCGHINARNRSATMKCGHRWEDRKFNFSEAESKINDQTG